MRLRRWWLAAVIVALIVAFFLFDLSQYLTLRYLKAQQVVLVEQFRAQPLLTAGGYFLLYVVVTALSLPGAAVMTLAGGAIFGLGWGTLIISFASTIGATLAFLAARHLFRDALHRRFPDRLAAIDRGMTTDGVFYLFTLRLVPLFPFFLINLLMGLTAIRTRTFYWVSQVGMLPATLVYVNAGTQLGQIESARGLLSPTLLFAFVLLGLFPFAAKKIVAHGRARRVLRRYPRPRRFDRNLIVIGGGAAGLVCAYLAAAMRAKVTLIEKQKMGGECLYTGCVPSKALIRSARWVADLKRAASFGIEPVDVRIDFARVMQRVQRVIRAIEPHDSVARYTKLGVECVTGEARLVSPYAVEVDGRRLTARAIILATGSQPMEPAIPGLSDIDYLTSDTVWNLTALPARLLVLGGGPIGCELAQCFARFGSRVTLIERGARLLPREDGEFGTLLQDRFAAEGIDVRVHHTVTALARTNTGVRAVIDHRGQSTTLEVDAVLVALGRRPQLQGVGAEEIGVGVDDHGALQVDDYLQTRVPTIYGCGDVVGAYQFTHTASHQAWYATVNALFGGIKRFKVDYSVIPWCTFTDPEIARVGLNEAEAKQRGIAYEVTTYDLADLDRAIADEAAEGRVKVLSVPGKDRVLGVTIAGAHAGDIIGEWVTAMRHGVGLNKILRTIHIYPTFGEANKYAAGAWKRAHAPEPILTWLARFHGWRRGG